MEHSAAETEHQTYRAGLVEQITRDMQTLFHLHKLGYCAHPGEEFYLDRIQMYSAELRKLDAADRGKVNQEGK